MRLTDIDIKLRRRHGQYVLDREMRLLAGDYERLAEFAAELHAAVEHPSDKVHWLPRDAVQRVLGR